MFTDLNIDSTQFNPCTQLLLNELNFLGKQYARQVSKQSSSQRRKIGRWFIGETLGKGGYSWVKKGYDRKDGRKSNTFWIYPSANVTTNKIDIFFNFSKTGITLNPTINPTLHPTSIPTLIFNINTSNAKVYCSGVVNTALSLSSINEIFTISLPKYNNNCYLKLSLFKYKNINWLLDNHDCIINISLMDATNNNNNNLTINNLAMIYWFEINSKYIAFSSEYNIINSSNLNNSNNTQNNKLFNYTLLSDPDCLTANSFNLKSINQTFHNLSSKFNFNSNSKLNNFLSLININETLNYKIFPTNIQLQQNYQKTERTLDFKPSLNGPNINNNIQCLYKENSFAINQQEIYFYLRPLWKNNNNNNLLNTINIM